MKNNAKIGEKLTSCFKFDEFWPEHSKVSKNCTLMGSFWTKYIMFELQKYRGVKFHYTEEWCKTEEKLICGFKNDVKNSVNLYQSTRKPQNFIQSRKCMSLKFTEELCVNEEECKMWKGINLPF